MESMQNQKTKKPTKTKQKTKKNTKKQEKKQEKKPLLSNHSNHSFKLFELKAYNTPVHLFNYLGNSILQVTTSMRRRYVPKDTGAY
jgi:hypothetical protein